MRIVVLVAVATLLLSWQQLSSSSLEVPVSLPPPAEQPVLAGTALQPAALPPATPSSAGGKSPRPKAKATSKRVQRQRKARQRTSARQASRPTRGAARKPWRHGGGRDISWPQCPRSASFGGRHGLGQPMPDPGVSFVIVGLTNGRAFTPNPCLAMHLRWVRRHHVHASAYAFAAYPSKVDLRRYRTKGPYDGARFLGRLKNSGHAGARYNIRTMKRHGFTTPHVWLDVEPSSSRPWSGRRDWNAAVVKGWVRAYRDAGYTVGVYSTPHLWRGIVGRLRLGLPEWRTAGPASPRAALAKCRGESIQGGRAVVAQWWTQRRDFDRICPGLPRGRTMARYFHKW